MIMMIIIICVWRTASTTNTHNNNTLMTTINNNSTCEMLRILMSTSKCNKYGQVLILILTLLLILLILILLTLILILILTTYRYRQTRLTQVHHMLVTQCAAILVVLKIHQRGVQWKQGVVTCMMLYTSLLCNTAPFRCTPLRLHPPLQSIQVLRLRRDPPRWRLLS